MRGGNATGVGDESHTAAPIAGNGGMDPVRGSEGVASLRRVSWSMRTSTSLRCSHRYTHTHTLICVCCLFFHWMAGDVQHKARQLFVSFLFLHWMAGDAQQQRGSNAARSGRQGHMRAWEEKVCRAHAPAVAPQPASKRPCPGGFELLPPPPTWMSAVRGGCGRARIGMPTLKDS